MMETPCRAEDRVGAILSIDLDAIVGNWRSLAARVGSGVTCAAVVKADAYGLGADKVAPALEAAGCSLFFVAHLDEAIALRQRLPTASIAVLNGLFRGTAGEFVRHRLTPVLNDLGQIDDWRGEATRGPGNDAFIHVDTGMARLGLPPDELGILAAEPERLETVGLAGVMSHFACADEPGHPLNGQQAMLFTQARACLPAARASLANSSGIFLGPENHLDIVRPGAALYGLNPLPGHPNPMAQVIRLKGKIAQVRDVDRGQTVGYGATHRQARHGRIATVAIGYADGLLRSLSNRGRVFLDGFSAPIVGRVSMDLITVDVTDVAPGRAHAGAWVDIIGPDQDLDTLALDAGTIGYEVLTSLGHRYHRVHVGAAAAT